MVVWKVRLWLRMLVRPGAVGWVRTAGGAAEGRDDDGRPRAVVLLGTPIDDVTMDEAVDRIAAMVAVGRARAASTRSRPSTSTSSSTPPTTPRSSRVMQRTDLAIPDGMGIVWGAAARRRADPGAHRRRRSGAGAGRARRPRRVADLPVRRRARRRRAGGGVLGAAQPGAVVVGLEAPTVGARRDDGHRPRSRRSRRCAPTSSASPSGTPSRSAGSPVTARPSARPCCIGIGGTLDFLTGVTQRAPAWMQRGGLEWIHRAASEPRRLAGRYAQDLAVFGPALLRQRWTGRRRGAATVPFDERDGDGRLVRCASPARRPALLDRPARRRPMPDGRSRSTRPPSIASTTSPRRRSPASPVVPAGWVRASRSSPNCRFEIGPIGPISKDRS